jgi:DNA invertase Pin-like site-specific DNA recombinase
MGRLTLNILLSFAQFEREVIGERLASEEMVEFSASGAPERPATSLAQARRGDEVAIGTVG